MVIGPKYESQPESPGIRNRGEDPLKDNLRVRSIACIGSAETGQTGSIVKRETK